MIATENFDIKNNKTEATNQPSSNNEVKKSENVDTNVKSSNSSSVPSISSSSFNSFANSPNTSTSSSPTNKDNNYKKKITKNHINYNDPLLNSYQSNYGAYYVAPMFGFENIPFSDLNNPLVNPYYEYAQQLFGFSNYPTYFPADFSQNWNSSKNYENRKKDKTYNSQKANQNFGTNQKKYKKPYNKRGENDKVEEPKQKPKDYDLMQNEQVYVSAYPALPSSNSSESADDKVNEIKQNDENENKIKLEVATQGVWSEKKWSEIVTGNKMFQNESFVNYESNAQNTHNEHLEEKLKDLDLNDEENNSKYNNEKIENKKTEKTFTKRSNYKKDKFNHNYYYPSFNSQINTSGMFSGMAEMVSQVDFDAKSDVWTQDKWKGKFEIKWIFFKDVPNSRLKHITLANNENKPVTHSRDAQEIPFDKGVEMLDVFRNYKHTSTLFDIPIDIYQTENYMYNLMLNTYNAQPKYVKYQYRASDYKWKNPSQAKENNNQEETNRS